MLVKKQVIDMEKLKLEKIIAFKNGKKKPNTEGNIPIYGGNGILGYTDQSNAENCVIVGRVGAYCGSVYYEPGQCWVSDNAIVARSVNGSNINYIYYLLKNLKLNDHHIGSGQPLLTQGILNSIESNVALPITQGKIAEVLRILDNKIKQNEKINNNLLQQASSIFKAWFIDPDISEHEDWQMVTLEDITSLVTRGIAPKYSDESDQIVINQKCIRDHMLDLSPARKHLPKKINEKWLKKGDLLINSTGQGTLGRAAQIWFDPVNMTVDSHVTIVRPKNEKLIYYIGIWGILHEREIESLHTGSTGQTELPRDRVKGLELLLPDENALDQFNSVVKPITEFIISNQNENIRLADLRDSLLPKLMSGEIDISDIDL